MKISTISSKNENRFSVGDTYYYNRHSQILKGYVASIKDDCIISSSDTEDLNTSYDAYIDFNRAYHTYEICENTPVETAESTYFVYGGSVKRGKVISINYNDNTPTTAEIFEPFSNIIVEVPYSSIITYNSYKWEDEVIGVFSRSGILNCPVRYMYISRKVRKCIVLDDNTRRLLLLEDYKNISSISTMFDNNQRLPVFVSYEECEKSLNYKRITAKIDILYKSDEYNAFITKGTEGLLINTETTNDGKTVFVGEIEAATIEYFDDNIKEYELINDIFDPNDFEITELY